MTPIVDLEERSVRYARPRQCGGNPREVGSRRGRLTLVSFAVGTDFVRLEFQQILDGLLILGGLARSRASRHNPWESR